MKDQYRAFESEIIDSQDKKIANEYLSYLMMLDRSPVTVNKHWRVLDKLLTTCPVVLSELTTDDVDLWLRSNEMTPASLEATLTVLSGFFKFCMEEGHINRVLVKDRWRPRRHKSMPKYLDRAEQARIRLQVEKESVRDRILMEFMILGCRCSEVSAINVEDVDFNNRTVYVEGKERIRRGVHISEYCVLLIKDYLENRLAQSKSALFLNGRG